MILLPALESVLVENYLHRALKINTANVKFLFQMFITSPEVCSVDFDRYLLWQLGLHSL